MTNAMTFWNRFLVKGTGIHICIFASQQSMNRNKETHVYFIKYFSLAMTHISLARRSFSCDMETTFCLQTIPNGSLSARGAYTCLCNFGFYIPNQKLQGYEGVEVESGRDSEKNYTCIPCPDDCRMCDGSGSCYNGEIEETWSMDTWSVETLMLATIGVVLVACILCCVILAAIVFRQRKCRVSPHRRRDL